MTDMPASPPSEPAPGDRRPVPGPPAAIRRSSRRSFLIAGGLGLGTLAIGGGATAAALRSLRSDGRPRPSGSHAIATPNAAPFKSSDRRLVVITLYGGNDGLNTVAPVNNSIYRSARGALALDPTATHALADGFELHPSMPAAKGLWDAGHLIVVLGAGSPDRDRSHFKLQDEWQTADPTAAQRTGWIGRWLDATGTDPLRALATTPTMPLLLLGAKASGSTLPAAGRRTAPLAGAVRDAYAALMAAPRDGLFARAATVGTDLLTVERHVGDALAAGGTGALDDASTGELQLQLDAIAKLVLAGLPTKVYAASLGGFDTHAGQADTHARLLAELDTALGHFFAGLGDHAGGVVVMVHSEFGRRVATNGSEGTDHGRASVVLLAGPSVKGGLAGDPPPLDRLDDGDLSVTTDYRSIYAGVLTGVDIDPTICLGSQHPPALDLFH